MMLSYGNPNIEYIKLLQQETYLDSLLPELKSFPYPANDSKEVENELNELVGYISILTENREMCERYKAYDLKFEDKIIDILEQSDIKRDEAEKIITAIKIDTLPLLIKLKYFYQRVRPNQLAFYYNIPVYPYISTTAITPSYPSGHSFQAKLFCEVLGNTYPKTYKSLIDLFNDISVSRIFLGTHYESDVDFGTYCADVILNHPEFKKKYRL